MEYTTKAMNALDIIGRDLQTITTEKLIQERVRKRKTLEAKSIKAEQIQTGSGTLDPSSSPYLVPEEIVRIINDPPNPDRNGITYMWAYNLYLQFQTDVTVLNAFCNLLRIQRVREGEIQASGLGIHETKPASLAFITQEQYRKLRDFVRGCFVPSLNNFNLKQNSKNTNLEILALNLWKTYHDVMFRLSSTSS